MTIPSIDQKAPAGWLRRQAEIVTSIGVLAGALSAVVIFFGGSFPPWYTPAQAQESQRQSAQIQADTVTALGKINNKLDTVARRVDQWDCNNLRQTLEQANTGLARRPDDLMAKALRDSTQTRMRDIQGCAP